MEDTRPFVQTEKPQPKRPSAFRRFLRWFVFILIVVISLFIYWKYYFTYSDGIQGGKMQKISRKGNVFKTWEGYLLISSAVDNNSLSLTSKEWYFSVDNDSLAHLLEQFSERKVKLRYHQKNGTLAWRGETPYLIYDVMLDQ